MSSPIGGIAARYHVDIPVSKLRATRVCANHSQEPVTTGDTTSMTVQAITIEERLPTCVRS
jgi:hypothetical protein